MKIFYKDRDPIETINLIQKFFNSYNLTVEVSEDQSEIGTFYCKLNLFNNKIFILSSAGKGLTKELALASGYGELYERFCNKTFLLNSLTVNKKINDLKILDQIDIDFNQEILKDYSNAIFNGDIIALQDYCNAITDGYYSQDTFQHINKKNCIILDDRIMFKITGSTGMCAGNSFEEAFNQGMSEIYERWCHNNFINNEPLIFYQLSDEFLSTLNIYKYIQNLKKLNYEIYIFDLGYNFKVPVILTFIINYNKMNAYYNLGSFPIIEVAIERTLTETYQGVKSYNDIDKIQTQIPYRSSNQSEILSKNAASTLHFFCINENIFNKIKIVNKSSQYFLNNDNNNITNKEIFLYFQKLNKEHNFNIYIQNNSIINEIQALYLVCPEIIKEKYKNTQFNNIYANNDLINLINEHKQLIINLLNNNLELSLINLLNIQKNQYLQKQVNILLYGDSLNFYSTILNNKTISDLLLILYNYNNLITIQDQIFNILPLKLYQINLIKFILIQNYIKAGYSPLEILNLNTFLTNKNISIEDINNNNNPIYLLNNIFIIPFQNYYYSLEYKDIISKMYERKEKK